MRRNKMSKENINLVILKDMILYDLDRVNSKLSSFFEEAKISLIGETLYLVIDDENGFIKKVLESERDLILVSAISNTKEKYIEVIKKIKIVECHASKVRCSTKGVINLPKKILEELGWKVSDDITMLVTQFSQEVRGVQILETKHVQHIY